MTQPIEQQLVGIDDMRYLASSRTNDGALTTKREKLAEAVLPPEVTRGAVFTAVRLPDAPSLERADAARRQVEDIYRPSFPARC